MRAIIAFNRLNKHKTNRGYMSIKGDKAIVEIIQNEDEISKNVPT